MVLVKDLLECQLHKWYPKFKPHTIRTLFHPLPQSYLSYLQGLSQNLNNSNNPNNSDSNNFNIPPTFFLPNSNNPNTPFPQFTSHPTIPDPDSEIPDSDSQDSESDSGIEIPAFPELESEIQKSISSLGGEVVPKLNWSAPKDATWISLTGSLKCQTFSEISLLLHSSDCIIHDLTEALSQCEDFKENDKIEFFLCLRKWFPGIRPELEFRCFVKNKNLVAISQRDVTTFYPSLLTQQDEIVDKISIFSEEVVKPEFTLKDYTFDVYLTKKERRVILLDFNPWGAFTLPLLFDWDEFEGDIKGVDLRIVEDYMGVRPGIKTAVPYDYLDTGEGSGWDNFLRNAEVEVRRQMKIED